jgi:acetyl esterase/lipase
MEPGASSWPGAVYDCKAAVQFVRARSAELGLAPHRIGLIGDSAGAHLSSLVALAGEKPLFASEHRDDRYASLTYVKAVIGF